MARARTMPRHTAVSAEQPAEQADQAAPETSAWVAPAAGQDLDEAAMPEASAMQEQALTQEQAPTQEQATRGGGQHSARRQSQHKNRQDEEHHSKFEDRSVLDALWSAMVAAPTSVMSPPTSSEPEAVEPAPQPESEPAPAAVPEAAKPTKPAVGVAQAITVAPPEDWSPPARSVPAVTGIGGATPLATAPAPAAAPVLAKSSVAGAILAGVAGGVLSPAKPGLVAPASTDPASTVPIVDEPRPAASVPGFTPIITADAVADPAAAEPGLSGLGRSATATNRTIWAGPRHAAPHDWNSTSALLMIETPAAATDTGLLVLRLVIGLTMAAHGAQKAFGAFGGPGLHGTADMFASLGYQPGMLFALAAVMGELCGGLLLTVGLLTPLAAGGIIGVTVNAMVSVNFSNGFFATNNGIELPLLLSLGALGLLLAGPGRYAADARIPFFNGLAVQCAAASVAMFALLTSLAAHLL